MSRNKRMRRMVMHSKLHFLFTEERNWPCVRPAHMVVTSVLGGHNLTYVKTLHNTHLMKMDR